MPFLCRKILHGHVAILLLIAPHVRGRTVLTAGSSPSALLPLLHHLAILAPPCGRCVRGGGGGGGRWRRAGGGQGQRRLRCDGVLFGTRAHAICCHHLERELTVDASKGSGQCLGEMKKNVSCCATQAHPYGTGYLVVALRTYCLVRAKKVTLAAICLDISSASFGIRIN